jgi:hypothetical protein
LPSSASLSRIEADTGLICAVDMREGPEFLQEREDRRETVLMFPIVMLTGAVSGYPAGGRLPVLLPHRPDLRGPVDPRDDHDALLSPRFDRSRNR